MHWLRVVIAVKMVVTALGWGLPALFGPAGFLAWFDISMPADPIFLRLFGALLVALVLLYWYAYRDPVRNVAVLRFAVVDNGLATVTIIVVGLTTGLSSWYFWVSGALTALFCGLFAVLMPRPVE